MYILGFHCNECNLHILIHSNIYLSQNSSATLFDPSFKCRERCCVVVFPQGVKGDCGVEREGTVVHTHWLSRSVQNISGRTVTGAGT